MYFFYKFLKMFTFVHLFLINISFILFYLFILCISLFSKKINYFDLHMINRYLLLCLYDHNYLVVFMLRKELVDD